MSSKANRRRRQRPRARPVDVFISYAKQDNGYYTLLYRQLSIVEMNGFRVFASPLIPAGALRHEETKRALATATVALLLVSPDPLRLLPASACHVAALTCLTSENSDGGLAVETDSRLTF